MLSKLTARHIAVVAMALAANAVSGTVDEESGGFSGVGYLAQRGHFSAPRVQHVIIPEPLGGAHKDPESVAAKVGDCIAAQLEEIGALTTDALLADRPIAAGTETLVLINGSGGTTMMELLTIYGEVAGYLEEQGVPARSPMIGSYSTTQEMGGFSISLFTPTADMARYWRAPHGAPLFPHLAGMGD